jgi:hypothetical protein
MKTLNHSDYTALNQITTIFKQLKEDKNPSVGDYLWALDMIQNEIHQTGRKI